MSYSSTGAVYIAGNVAVIGDRGSDMDHGAVRGYVSAFDVDTGALKWRVYTVPDAPGKPFESPLRSRWERARVNRSVSSYRSSTRRSKSYITRLDQVSC